MDKYNRYELTGLVVFKDIKRGTFLGGVGEVCRVLGPLKNGVETHFRATSLLHCGKVMFSQVCQ